FFFVVGSPPLSESAISIFLSVRSYWFRILLRWAHQLDMRSVYEFVSRLSIISSSAFSAELSVLCDELSGINAEDAEVRRERRDSECVNSCPIRLSRLIRQSSGAWSLFFVSVRSKSALPVTGAFWFVASRFSERRRAIQNSARWDATARHNSFSVGRCCIRLCLPTPVRIYCSSSSSFITRDVASACETQPALWQ